MNKNSIKIKDIVLFVSEEEKEFIVEIKEKIFSTHLGNVDLAKLIGKPWGVRVSTHLGKTLYVIKPSLSDLTRHIKRKTQIIFPKDLGYILMKLDVGPGKRVLECGTGSGSLTLAFAWMVGPSGKVITYEIEEAFSALAKSNLEKVGLVERVEFKIKDAKEGFDEKDMDAVFLDVKTPWEYLKQAYDALAPGRTLGIFVPTANQVSKTLQELETHPFIHPEVCELMLRRYKPNPERLRPEDRMVAHTGYLIFARKILEEINE